MSDSEYEEESVVAVVELKGIMNSDILFQEKPAKILAPESENPVLQFGDYIFRGEWQQTMGTVVCFEKPEDKDAKEKCKFVAKADKKLSLQRIFLEEKKDRNGIETTSSQNVNGSDVEMKDNDLCNGHNHGASTVNGKADNHKKADSNLKNANGGHKSSHLVTEAHPSLEGTSRRSTMDSQASGSGCSYYESNSASASGLSKDSQLRNKRGVQKMTCAKRIHPKECGSSSQSLNQDGENSQIACKKRSNLQETAGRVLNDVLSQIESTGKISHVVDSAAGSNLSSSNRSNSRVLNTYEVLDLNVASSSSAAHVQDSVKDAELASESEDKSVGSSEADFIVLSEYCNEASCDTEGEIPVELNEPADSSDEVCLTRQKVELLSTDCVESSGNEAGIASVATEGNLVTVVVDSVLSEGQGIQCAERASSMSPVIHEDDVADSASSVEESKCTQRNSESFYPLVCDSASGEGTTHSQAHESEDMEINTADCSDTFHISTSARISSSQYFANVFEDEAMDTTENITERLSLGNEVDSVEVMEVVANVNEEQGPSRILNFPEPQCSRKRGVVNSTVGGASNASVEVILLQEEEVSGSSEEDDLCVSHSSSAIVQNFNKTKDSGLIDSTSNKVCCMSKSAGSNLKPIPGIDSTTNDSGRKRSQGESSKKKSSNLVNIVNERIDSTMNRADADTPPEDVDFEMREATNVAEVEDDDMCKKSNVEEREPIDSTSSIIQHTKNFRNVGNVSESSAVTLGESSQHSYMESRAVYSPCNVTESHIDDSKPLSSFVVSSPGSENIQSESAVSSERSNEILQDITESESYGPHNYDVTESSLQDDSCGASSSQTIGPCGSSSYKNYRSDLDIDNEDDSVNKVTESLNSPSYSSMNSKNSKASMSTQEVTDSTNISYSSRHLNSEELFESPLVIMGDSSVCEVTESSAVVGEEVLAVDAQNSPGNNSRHIYSQHCTESPSSGEVASGSDVTESRRFVNESYFSTDNNSSSGDGKEPSSSGLNTSEINASEACSSAGVVSIENEIYCYSSAGSQDVATNEVSMSSSSVYWSSPLLAQASDYEISNSLEQNADSTEGENQSSPSNCNNESSSAGGDSSKLPSSTSN